jgi:NADH:ubiquinone oxidoreductase subunit 2 (subunit N)
MLEYFSNLFLGFGLLCLVFGAVAALSQQDLKKFLALTSISHMGSILISLHIMDDDGFASAFQYLGIYVVSSSVIFYCLATTRLQHKDGQLLPITLTSIPELRYFKSASSTNSTVALTISFVSMAGAAPLAGF